VLLVEGDAMLALDLVIRQFAEAVRRSVVQLGRANVDVCSCTMRHFDEDVTSTWLPAPNRQQTVRTASASKAGAWRNTEAPPNGTARLANT